MRWLVTWHDFSSSALLLRYLTDGEKDWQNVFLRSRFTPQRSPACDLTANWSPGSWHRLSQKVCWILEIAISLQSAAWCLILTSFCLSFGTEELPYKWLIRNSLYNLNCSIWSGDCMVWCLCLMVCVLQMLFWSMGSKSCQLTLFFICTECIWSCIISSVRTVLFLTGVFVRWEKS